MKQLFLVLLQKHLEFKNQINPRECSLIVLCPFVDLGPVY